MTEKPTYEELEQRVKELKKDVTACKQVEKALKESEKRFKLLYERVPLGYQSLDENGHFIEVSQAWLDTFGYSIDEVIGKSFGDFLHPDWTDHFKDHFRRFKDAGEVLGVEFKMVKKDGSNIIVLFDGKIGKDEKGNFLQTHCILHDMISQKRVEKALLESEERYKSLFKNNHSVMLLIDPESGDIVDANPAAISYYGWSYEELISKKITNINTLTDEQVFQKMEQAKKLRRRHFYFQHRLANGDIRDVEVYSGPIQIHGKQLLYSIIHDISKRKQAEDALQQSEALLKSTQKLTKVGGWEWDVQKQSGFWTEEVYRIHGLEPKAIKHESSEYIELSIKCHDPEDRSVILEAFINCIEKGKPYDLELPFTKVTGDRIWIRTKAEPVMDGNRILKIIGNIMDITERKLAEKVLRRSEKKLGQQAQSLEETNKAFSILLDHRAKEKKQFEKNVLNNLKNLVIPYLEKIKRSEKREDILDYLSFIERNLNEITSAFSRELTGKQIYLTQTEIQIANLIKIGKTSKEIAPLLDVTPKTVFFHRENIRKKLGLTHRKINLRSYLQTIL